MTMRDVAIGTNVSMNPIEILFRQKYRGNKPPEEKFLIDENEANLIDELENMLIDGKR